MSILAARPLLAAKAGFQPTQLATGSVSLAAQQRDMATLKEIQLRLRSISNISKITKSMKMIASTKMNRAQRGMETARVYGKADRALYNHLAIPAESAPGKTLVVAVSSDKGLCGSIHSSVSKYIRRSYEPSEVLYAVIGDKVRSQLNRGNTKGSLAVSFSQVAKNGPTFYETSLVAERILESVAAGTGNEVDKIQVVYNNFRSVIAFDTGAIDVIKAKHVAEAPGFRAYELPEDESTLLTDMEQFHLANTLFWALSEGHAAEMSARRTAMENATKNAGEIIQKLTITYNRTRQAAITNELVDIITGASAL
ncbi:atp3 gamma subunit of the F1 sector of mitochondrial F1F0 ATP synthase [Gonapodya sp. JEL0774]|nr:atp3 gamma subunit of the F1 sector of mitochondrial F1F0 ATP synthase [Gonapodya sp. JEL0774]